MVNKNTFRNIVRMTDSAKHSVADSEDDESDHFSDIDDAEVNRCLHTEKEKDLKKIIWEAMNREYLEEQAAKEAVVADAKEAYEAKCTNISEDLLAAKELANATAAALAKSRKEKKQRRAKEAKNRTPLSAAGQMLKRKTFSSEVISSKVNYEALEALFNSGQDNAKKRKVESDAGDPCDPPSKTDHYADDLDVEDGDEQRASEDNNYDASYDDYRGDEDKGYDYGDKDYGYEDDFDFA
ncbi:transcription factor IIIB 70 kDa subunit-like [Zingiber officinale]|uniref:transcription factor IIIB 70 kDa subunit-like n=1 Tax=Zingiber officinale TaxID=94328 RepID=UPI001C4B4ADD|nr:transcription factor IIIB 70 kDa subunit-like [Zingiber officinale]